MSKGLLLETIYFLFAWLGAWELVSLIVDTNVTSITIKAIIYFAIFLTGILLIIFAAETTAEKSSYANRMLWNST